MAGRTAARRWVLTRLLAPRVWRGRGKVETPRKILVLHHLLLGDTLMLTPLLAKLRERYLEAEILLACPRALLPLFAARPFGVQALHFDPRDRHTLAGLAQHGPYDVCLIPAENRYTPLARALQARHVCGFAGDKPGWKNALLDEARPFPDQPACFGDFAADLIDGPPPRRYQPEDWPWAPSRDFQRPSQPYAVLHLGASSPLKYWPASRWQALANWLNAQGITPIWSAGAKETELVRQADAEGRFTSLAGQLDLLQLAHLLREATLLVCPDTGVAHLGRLTGTPTATLFGPGSPEISGAGEYWRDSRFEALSAPISCRDQDVTFRRHAKWIKRCARSYGLGQMQCPAPRCMEMIPLEEVQAACARLLGLA